jgi:hypothetical protein
VGPQVVHEAPHPPPNHPPASEVAGPSAFDGLPEQIGDAGPPVDGQVIERLKVLITTHHDPVETAKFVINSLKTNEMKAALTKHKGDINGIVAEHLGLWAMADEANREYLGRLGQEVERIGVELGVFAPDDEDEGDEAAE